MRLPLPLDAVRICGTPFTHVDDVPPEAAGAAVTPGLAAGAAVMPAGTGAGVRTDVGGGVCGEKGAGVGANVTAARPRTALPPNEVIGDAANVEARAAPFRPLPEMTTVMTTLPALTVALTALAGMPSLAAISAVITEIVLDVYWSTVPSSVMRSWPIDCAAPGVGAAVADEP